MARIVVVGGSLGGLFAANVLLRDGHEVAVLEKVRGPMDGRGAGIVSHEALEAALARAGLAGDAAIGVSVPGRVLLRADGSAERCLDMPQVLTSWSRLYQLLRSALPAGCYHQGVAVTGSREDAEGVEVQAVCEGRPQRWRADLLVASDGLRSAVRQQLFAAVQPRYAGYVAWRGVCDESLLSQHTLDSLFPRFGFGVQEDSQIIGYPVAGPGHALEPGRRAYNFVWYRPVAEGPALTALMTDADGQHHPLGVPPNRVSWRHIAEVRERARQQLAPQFAEVIQKCGQVFFQPIYDLQSERLVAGRMALMGDAAFVARPHVGMGVTKAAQDAVALADALRAQAGTLAALRAYEAVRLPAGRQAVARARWLGAWLEPAGATAAQPPPALDAAARAHQALTETAIDLGRYGHLSAFTFADA